MGIWQVVHKRKGKNTKCWNSGKCNFKLYAKNNPEKITEKTKRNTTKKKKS